jgi:hypothetical protein
MVVVKKSANSEKVVAIQANSASDFANTLNAELLAIRIRRGNQNLNTNITSERRASCTANASPIERNIACKPALGLLGAVIPVENNGEVQPVSNSGPALWFELHDFKRAVFHKKINGKPVCCPSQSAKRLKIS